MEPHGAANAAQPLGTGRSPELRVADVKQYLYCPRVIYYHYVLPVERKVTYKMQVGREEHVEIDRLEKRRKLGRYRLAEGERRFHVALASPQLGLSGVLDLLIVSPAGYFPVEYKVTTGGPALNHKYQLVAYALLVEEAFGAVVRSGFLYLAPRRELVEVPVTDNARLHTRRILGAIRRIIAEGRLPAVRHRFGRCRDCEFLNYCGDVERRGGARFLQGGMAPRHEAQAVTQVEEGDGDVLPE